MSTGTRPSMRAPDSVECVALPEYAIRIARGLLDAVGSITREVAPAHRYALLTDDVVDALYAERVLASFDGAAVLRLRISAGEQHKTRERWAELTDAMLTAGLGRDTTVIALGGGVVGDLAGFVAATYMRGVPFVQVPTTLLAMIDASIGGKTGVDTPHGKNLVGAFHQPAAVIVDPSVLSTLPPPYRRAGAAEAIKHGVIADPAYLAQLERSLPQALDDTTSDAMRELVVGSIAIKASVVREDVHERGRRKILNFGHTLGHAIEAASSYGIPHGEAVAIGMVLEARLAERIGVARVGMADRVEHVVRSAGLGTAIPAGIARDRIVALTHGDKKTRAGSVEYALPIEVGRMAGADRGWTVPVSDDDVGAALTTGA